MWIFCGNVIESGDVGGSFKKSFFFFLIVCYFEIGLFGVRV